MFEGLARTAKRTAPRQRVVQFGPWTGGMNTIANQGSLKKNEAVNIINMFLQDGRWQTRGAWIAATGATSPLTFGSEVSCFLRCTVNGSNDAYAGRTDGKIYRIDDLYTQGSASSTLIGTVSGEVRFTGFNDWLIIADGSYLKYYDGSSIELLYDAGLGTGAFFFLNRNGDLVDSVTYSGLGVGDATTSRTGYKFTTENWDAGYKLPAGRFYLKLAKKGNGYITTDTQLVAKIRKVSDDSVIATQTLMYASELPTETNGDGSAVEDYLEYTYDFGTTRTLDPNTEYYATLEYAGGDASNFVWVLSCLNTGPGYAYAAATWTQTTTTPLWGLAGNVGPKAAEVVVDGNRLIAIEGEDGDNPSYLWYCAVENPLDWSTDDGGGYIDMMRHIGAAVPFFDSVWIFGTEDTPFLARRSGDSPATWIVREQHRPVGTHYKAVYAHGSNLFFITTRGLNSLQAVQEYGDIDSVILSKKIDIVSEPQNATIAFCRHADSLVVSFSGLNTLLYNFQINEIGVPISVWWHSEPSVSGMFMANDGDNLIMFAKYPSGFVPTYYNQEVSGYDTPLDALSAEIPFTWYIATQEYFTDFGQLNARTIKVRIVCEVQSSVKDPYYQLGIHYTMDGPELVSKAATKFFPNYRDTTTLNQSFDRLQVNFNFRRLAFELSFLGLVDPGNGFDSSFYPVSVESVIVSCLSIGGF